MMAEKKDLKIVTIGVYGFAEDDFFEALQEAGVDVFCDIRRRRGVRGATYAFANSQRLQARLAQLSIRYLHWLQLAPSKEIRQLQDEADKAKKEAKRQRGEMDAVFVQAYKEECLHSLDLEGLRDALGEEEKVVALFCVEQHPAACHRSLVAEKLAEAWDVEVEHIVP